MPGSDQHISEASEWDTIPILAGTDFLGRKCSFQEAVCVIMVYTLRDDEDKLNSNCKSAFIIISEPFHSELKDTVRVKQFQVDAECVTFGKFHFKTNRSQENLEFLRIGPSSRGPFDVRFAFSDVKIEKKVRSYCMSEWLQHVESVDALYLKDAFLLLEGIECADYRFDAKILYSKVLFNPELLSCAAFEWARAFLVNVGGRETPSRAMDYKSWPLFVWKFLLCSLVPGCSFPVSPPGILETFFKYDHDKIQKAAGLAAGASYAQIPWWNPTWLLVLIQYCISYLQALCGDKDKEDYCFHFNRGMRGAC